MDAKTLEALKQSIKKWYKIAYNRGVDKKAKNCALCNLFSDRFKCGKCPIALRSEIHECKGTPWEKWIHYQIYSVVDIGEYRVFDERSQEIAIAEYKFLKSLLPEGEK